MVLQVDHPGHRGGRPLGAVHHSGTGAGRTLDQAVAVAFRKAQGRHGSPRLHEDLREAGWRVSEKTVAESMRRQGLVARQIRRRSGLTSRTRRSARSTCCSDFTAARPNAKWVGDITEIPTAAGKLYLATVIDPYPGARGGDVAAPRRGAARDPGGGDHPGWEGSTQVGGGVRSGSSSHTDRGLTGEFNWSSQHLDEVQLWRRGTGPRRRAMCPRVRVGNGVRIGRCVRRCVRPGGLSPRGRCSGSSGV